MRRIKAIWLAVVAVFAAGMVAASSAAATGSPWAWGANQWGQLGDGTVTGSDVPVPVSGGLSGVTAVLAGGAHDLALLGTGTVMAWGYNAEGQLGDGTDTGPELCNGEPCSKTPIAVGGLSGVTAISAGYDIQGDDFSLALLAATAPSSPGAITAMARWATAPRQTATSRWRSAG